ncbi:putative ribosomal protein YlxQ [Caloramator mitchellensis]|uniref:Putative ribosomal protein YlxQ n=1 Tax=Caloramator mitchellensis TaxID=908809 RepID=A0A0R3K0F7_CALMK|nr:ribosomal L7Ae/L30e/S12e/Gadd45 family protein [Caloramator mitchellensis]KRQ86990.1 putative ribosomal protein YlxQ [Caloramator mitchellensis]
MNNLYSFLGLMQRAGKLTSGDDGVEIDIKKRKSYLVIIAEDASENTMKRFMNMCENNNIRFVLFGQKSKIGNSIGKSARAVLSIKDKNFAEGFLSKLNSENTGGESIVNNKSI